MTGSPCVLCSGSGYLASNIYQSGPTGQVTEYKFVADGLAKGPDGNVWFAENDLTRHLMIGRITPAGRFKGFIVPGRTDSDFITAVIPGAGSKLLFLLESFESLTTVLGSITTSGHVSTILASNQLSQDQGFSVGRDGNLWFQNTSASGPRIEIDRISLA